MADRIVGFRESDWPAARDAINQVRRGGLEHPFHRRRGPVLGASASLVLFQWNGSDFLGPPTLTGVSTTGSATLVDHLVLGGGSASGGTITIDATYLRSLVPPEDFGWAMEGADGTYYAVTGGMIYFDGTMGSGQTFSADAGIAQIEAGPVIDICSGSLIEGQIVKTIFRYNSLDAGSFAVVDSCCPPST
jgi:hypothetical protein